MIGSCSGINSGADGIKIFSRKVLYQRIENRNVPKSREKQVTSFNLGIHHGFAQEFFSRFLISFLCEHELNRFAVFIDGAVQSAKPNGSALHGQPQIHAPPSSLRCSDSSERRKPTTARIAK